MSVKHNAHVVAARLGARGPAVQAAVEHPFGWVSMTLKVRWL